jgi:hypothetical protein
MFAVMELTPFIEALPWLERLGSFTNLSPVERYRGESTMLTRPEQSLCEPKPVKMFVK